MSMANLKITYNRSHIMSFEEYCELFLLSNECMLSEEFIINNKVLPINKDGKIIFLMSDYDFNIISDIEILLKKKINYELVNKELLTKLIKEYLYQNSSTGNEVLNIFSSVSSMDDDNKSVINYLNEIISEAIYRKVSDIHIEPFRDYIRIRYRIDGTLIVRDMISRDYYSIILTRIKILAGMDISERRLPQDGRITFTFMEREIDLRIATVPIIYGEKISIRLLDSDFRFSDIRSIGMREEDLNTLISSAKKLKGTIVISGPTNSGKTTTIYSILNLINSDGINIITLEDPVEYKIEGINQIQINYKTGLEFESTLNSLLRHDPDVLSIGELRSEATVKTALRASITGHLLLTTIHTNDSISTIYRLKNMGAENYLISGALDLIISQRLLKSLCPFCKEEYIDHSGLFKNPQKLYRAIGCNKCTEGYSGRVPVFEVLKINDEIRDHINLDADYNKILEIAMKNGFRTLKESYLSLLIDGYTSVEEVFKYI